MKTTEIFWASLETLLVEQHAKEIKKDKRLCLVKTFLLKNDNVISIKIKRFSFSENDNRINN